MLVFPVEGVKRSPKSVKVSNTRNTIQALPKLELLYYKLIHALHVHYKSSRDCAGVVCPKQSWVFLEFHSSTAMISLPTGTTRRSVLIKSLESRKNYGR